MRILPLILAWLMAAAPAFAAPRAAPLSPSQRRTLEKLSALLSRRVVTLNRTITMYGGIAFDDEGARSRFDTSPRKAIAEHLSDSAYVWNHPDSVFPYPDQKEKDSVVLSYTLPKNSRLLLDTSFEDLKPELEAAFGCSPGYFSDLRHEAEDRVSRPPSPCRLLYDALLGQLRIAGYFSDNTVSGSELSLGGCDRSRNLTPLDTRSLLRTVKIMRPENVAPGSRDRPKPASLFGCGHFFSDFLPEERADVAAHLLQEETQGMTEPSPSPAPPLVVAWRLPEGTDKRVANDLERLLSRLIEGSAQEREICRKQAQLARVAKDCAHCIALAPDGEIRPFRYLEKTYCDALAVTHSGKPAEVPLPAEVKETLSGALSLAKVAKAATALRSAFGRGPAADRAADDLLKRLLATAPAIAWQPRALRTWLDSAETDKAVSDVDFTWIAREAIRRLQPRLPEFKLTRQQAISLLDAALANVESREAAQGPEGRFSRPK